LDRRELGELGRHLLGVGRVERVLVLELRDQELQELLLPERRVPVRRPERGARRSRRRGGRINGQGHLSPPWCGPLRDGRIRPGRKRVNDASGPPDGAPPALARPRWPRSRPARGAWTACPPCPRRPLRRAIPGRSARLRTRF